VSEIVNAKTFGEGEGNMSVMQRLTLKYSPGHAGPEKLIAKLTPDNLQPRFIGAVLRLFDAEVQFYSQGFETCLSIPKCYYAECKPDGRFILLLEDLAPASTPDQIKGCTAEEAKQAVATIVPLHTEFIGKTRSDRRVSGWLTKTNDPVLYREVLSNETRKLTEDLEGFVESIGFTGESFAYLFKATQLMGDTMEQFVQLMDGMRPGEGGLAKALTVIHGDFRCENIFFPENRKPVTIDFQAASECLAESDLNYLVAGSLPILLRKDLEQDLLLQYHAAMVAAGCKDYPLWQCISNYQFCGCMTLLTSLMGLQACKDNPCPRSMELAKVTAERLSSFLQDWDFIEAWKRHVAAPFRLTEAELVDMLPVQYRKLLKGD